MMKQLQDDINTCFCCNRFYNIQERKPFYLSCGDIICLQCYRDQKDQLQNQQVQCPINKAHLCPIDQPVVEMAFMMRHLQQQDFYLIKCDNHPIENAQIYCRQNSFKLSNQAQNEEQKQAPAQNNNGNQIKEQVDLQVTKTLQKLVQADRPKHLEFRRLVDIQLESLKNNNINDKAKLLPLTGQSKLLFKATNDGFQASNFHQKCDNQGANISFILSEHGHVFGGYTSISWTSPLQLQLDIDNYAFVFGLSKNTLHKYYRSTDRAVWQHKDYLMQFGYSGDIAIYNDSNNNSSCYCNVGNTYKLQKSLKREEQQAQDYLGGSEQFKVLEIEVYQILDQNCMWLK
ncbi:UNKNOWN [Stylonychia lemnae]|uniref:TLDc domain-containing protein n=1 Tax=Stylonychia lemnae TaxID=5949 RepID=A0A078AEX4_STYLE|nr:UNKNOWN [Stylonychia lemnae]|eukprot:CDW80819.1 UNKNOWN [Stylonychia lemnae]